MQKRGQVTVFIIVGIIILAVFGFLFMLSTGSLKSGFDREFQKAVVPEQLAPVKVYIDDCLESKARVAIDTLSSRGGYLDIPEDILPRSINNPFSNSLEVVPGMETAYWFYESANGIQKEQIPTKEDMEFAIANYLDYNFADCYYELGYYQNQGFEIEIPDYVSSSVSILDKHVEVIVDAPMYVSFEDVTKTMEKHLVKIDVPLGEFYEASKDIIENELSEDFLEERTLDMMVVYEEVPYSDLEVSCERKIWNKDDVKDDFRIIASENIGALRLKNSENLNLYDSYDYFTIDVSAPTESTSTFTYLPSWPFVIEVSPSRGNLMLGDPITQGSHTISKALGALFCLSNYHFVYDIKYPVLVSLMDKNGYSFQFATMVVLDNNQPKVSEIEYVDYTDSIEMAGDLCGNPSVEVSVGAFDSESILPIGGASVSYQCSVTTCYLGETDSQGIFIGGAPACYGGRVLIDKEGYFPAEQDLSTNEETVSSVVLPRYYNLDLDVKLLDLRDGSVDPIGDKEITFQFENVDNGYIAVVSGESEEITLVPGRYKINSYVSGNPGFDVGAGGSSFRECVSVPKKGLAGLFFNEEKCFDVEFDEFELDMAVIGGAEFEWDSYSLVDYSKLTVYGSVGNIPSDISELTDIFNSISTNHLNSNFREPELS
jgi:hypothetical protein